MNLLNSFFFLPAVMGVITSVLVWLDLTHGILRDSSSAVKKPFSFSKVQLAFWFIIILGAFSSIIICIHGHGIPTLANSTLILLGISTGTLTAGRLIDVSDLTKSVARSQDNESEGFFADILSDNDGISLHRFQCLVFNFVIGSWFVYQIIHNLSLVGMSGIDQVIPELTPNNLVLLGISGGTYIALKANENKTQNILSVLPAVSVLPMLSQVVKPVSYPAPSPVKSDYVTLEGSLG